MEIKQEWKIITHLVSVGLDNRNGMEWGLYFSRYTDKARTGIRGGVIGYMTRDGKVKVCDKSKYKIVITSEPERCYGDGDVGNMIWLERIEDSTT